MKCLFLHPVVPGRFLRVMQAQTVLERYDLTKVLPKQLALIDGLTG